MISNSELSCEDGFQNLKAQFIDSPPAEQSTVSTVPTKCDTNRYSRAVKAGRAVEKATQQYVNNLMRGDPFMYEGVNIRVAVQSRPKSKPGVSNVLRSLIELILTSNGSAMTQTDCRTKVHAMYPDHAMFKDWTKPLPKWARDRAATLIETTNPAIAGIKVNSKTSLRDLHNAAKTAFACTSGEGQVFKTNITVHSDCVLINGTRIKLNINRSNGSEYATLRITRAALLTALQ